MEISSATDIQMQQ